MTRGHFWTSVTILCNVWNGRVTSGPRSAEANAQVGGVKNSAHITGFAADVVLQSWNSKQLFIRECQLRGIEVVDETVEKNHLHLQVALSNRDFSD